jgi:bacteriocin-like protein
MKKLTKKEMKKVTGGADSFCFAYCQNLFYACLADNRKLAVCRAERDECWCCQCVDD